MVSIPSNSRHAYYNEIDPEKCAWLRELMQRGVIADGEIDERSIVEVEAKDVQQFKQCHFFAGIGVWSYALRLAGWPDDRPVWTGSCPCPSFSAAGQGGGFADPRHLWPDWARLVRECKPATIFGEQADDAIGYGWLDLVQTDLERENYAVGKAVLGACSVGAPHIRQRLYFVAQSASARLVRAENRGAICQREAARSRSGESKRFCENGRMEHANLERRGEARRADSGSGTSGECASGELADANGRGFTERRITRAQRDGEQRSADVGMGNTDCTASNELSESVHRSKEESNRQWFGNGRERDGHSGAGYVNGFWRDADWILRKRWNRDDWEWCPTEPGTFPLAARTPNRVLKLRGYGDAIVPQVAQGFIEAFLESLLPAPCSLQPEVSA